MDRTGIVYILLAVCLVFGLFAYSNWDQTSMAAAQAETEIRLEREPKTVQATADLGMTVLAKVIAGVLTSLIVAAGILAYQQAKIRELKEGGWERFWQRRKAAQGQGAKPKRYGPMDMLAMIWTDEMMKRRSK